MAKTIDNGNARDLAEFMPAIATNSPRIYLHHWSSPEALAAHVAVKPDGAWHDSPWENGNGSFRGTASMAEAVSLCRDGWKDGAEQAASIRDRINARNPVGPRLSRYDVAGAFPSVPRALSGNPCYMKRIDAAKLRKRPVITLLSDICVQATIKQDRLCRRAAVVAAIIDAIEAAGYACNVIATGTTDNGKVCARTSVQAKASDQPADIARLAFTLGHASMLRRFLFATWGENSFTEGLTRGLGLTSQPAQTAELSDRQIYIIPSAQDCHDLFASDDKAATDGLGYLLRALFVAGCPAFPSLQAA